MINYFVIFSYVIIGIFLLYLLANLALLKQHFEVQ